MYNFIYYRNLRERKQLKAYPQDKKSAAQKNIDLWNIAKETEKQDKSSTTFKDTLANLRK